MKEGFIKEVTKNLKTTLKNVYDNGVKKEFKFEIDCESLKDFNNVDIRESSEFKEIFNELINLNGPVLYWFEILSENDNDYIRQQLQKYSITENSKASPAMKNSFDENSKCLYVGKVKKAVWGRMIQHLGFYKVKGTQGLQLFHWAKGLKLHLKVHLLEFEPEMADLISIFEIELAKLKKPIVGKH